MSHDRGCWKWWTIFVILAFVSIFMELYISISHYLFVVDITYLSFLIVLLFLVSNSFLAYFSYSIQYKKTKISETALKPLWFTSDAMLSLGMVGTLIGFMMVLGNALDIDAVTSDELKKVIAEVASGLSVALITTLTGLICSIILKIQLVLLDVDNENL